MPIFAYSGGLSRPMPQYGAANARGITHYTFDDESGLFTRTGETLGIDDTAWLVLDAKNHRLYATCERKGADQSAVAAFAIDPRSGALTELGPRQDLHGNEACHASITRDGRYLLVANYNGAPPPGSPQDALTVLPIAASGLGSLVSSIRHTGSGPNRERQTTAHAHCVVTSPDGLHAYVADLGMDRILCYRIGADGAASPHPAGDIGVEPGLGPRHIVFHPGGRLMLMVSELIPRVVSFAVNPASGALTRRDTFAIEPTSDRIIQPAGIVITADERHLFAALRVHDEILGLAIEPDTGRLAQTGRWPSGGATPRDLTLSPSGRHLIVANQDSDRLTVFAVDQANGTLSGPVQQQPAGTPMAIVLATFPS